MIRRVLSRRGRWRAAAFGLAALLLAWIVVRTGVLPDLLQALDFALT